MLIYASAFKDGNIFRSVILPKCLSFLLLFPFMMIEGFVAVILLRPGLLLIAVSPPGIDVLPSTVLSASNWWVGLLKVKDETYASRRYMDSDKVFGLVLIVSISVLYFSDYR